jgi:peptidylprolyl isomerase
MALSTDAPRGAEGKSAYRSAGDIIEAAPPSAWRLPDPENLLYMELPQGRVVIELAPQFAPEHVANIKKLAQEHFWDGTSIYRAQDNFVVQFGDADADEPDQAAATPAPPGRTPPTRTLRPPAPRKPALDRTAYA